MAFQMQINDEVAERFVALLTALSRDRLWTVSDDVARCFSAGPLFDQDRIGGRTPVVIRLVHADGSLDIALAPHGRCVSNAPIIRAVPLDLTPVAGWMAEVVQ